MNIVSKYLTIILGLILFESNLFAQNAFKEKAKVVPSDRSALDFFGASLDMSEDVAMICSSGADSDENDENPLETAGAVYSYEKINGNWQMTQKIVPSDRNSQDVFGSSVAVSGNLAVIGAALNRTDRDGMNSIQGAGAVFVFEKDEQGIWIEKQKLVTSDRAEQDNFGFPVAVSDERIVVSSVLHNSRQGAIYIFDKGSEGQWNETAKLVAGDAEASAAFGFSIDLEGDYLAVGAQTENDDANDENYKYQAGAVYLFERNESGDWNQVQKIVPDDRAAGDLFGYSLDLKGSRLVVGAPLQDKSASGSLNNAGAAYLFHKDENGHWSQTQKLEASDRSALDNFGDGVSLSENLLVVGAPEEDEDQDGAGTIKATGSIYIFQADIDGHFTEIQKVVTSDRMEDDKIGRFKSMKVEKNQLIVGSFGQDLNEIGEEPLSNAGAAYFFELANETMPPLINVPTVQYGQVVKIDLSSDPDDVTSTDYYRLVSAVNGQVYVEGELVSSGFLFESSAIVTFRPEHAGNSSISFSKLSSTNESDTSTHKFKILQAQATITLADLEQEADGSVKAPTVTTDPANLNVEVTYSGGASPTVAGDYDFIVRVVETNYEGEESGTLKLIQVLGLTDTPIQVYPNPVRDYLHINSEERLKVEIMSLDGRKLIDDVSKDTINLHSLSNGTYLLRLTNNQGKSQTMRFVRKIN